MIGAMNSQFQMQGMSAMGGMSRMQGPPPGPPPGGDPVEQLETAYENGEVDTEELSAKLLEVFGEEAVSSVVSEDGTIDFESLTSLISAERSEQMTEDLTEKFGEEAAAFVSETGEIDHEGLKAYLEESGFEPPEKPSGPPPGGVFGGGQPMGYGPQGEATSTSNNALNFLDVFA